jgi:hypothetical protein
MSDSKSRPAITYSDPWLTRERPPLPDRLSLIAAYEVQAGTRDVEQALFLRTEGGIFEVWIATFWDLSPVLAWTDANHTLRRPALNELEALPASDFGRILRFVAPAADERTFCAVVEGLLHIRSGRETAGKSIHCGLVSEPLYARLWEELQEHLATARSAPTPAPRYSGGGTGVVNACTPAAFTSAS